MVLTRRTTFTNPPQDPMAVDPNVCVPPTTEGPTNSANIVNLANLVISIDPTISPSSTDVFTLSHVAKQQAVGATLMMERAVKEVGTLIIELEHGPFQLGPKTPTLGSCKTRKTLLKERSSTSNSSSIKSSNPGVESDFELVISVSSMRWD
uniref:Uncharacterized protein n=1 Tax=Cannabis sativa TaxID=3483 RepID=A0A803QGT9_CANSA